MWKLICMILILTFLIISGYIDVGDGTMIGNQQDAVYNKELQEMVELFESPMTTEDVVKNRKERQDRLNKRKLNGN